MQRWILNYLAAVKYNECGFQKHLTDQICSVPHSSVFLYWTDEFSWNKKSKELVFDDKLSCYHRQGMFYQTMHTASPASIDLINFVLGQ